MFIRNEKKLIKHAYASSTKGTPLEILAIVSIGLSSKSQFPHWSNDYKNRKNVCLWNLGPKKFLTPSSLFSVRRVWSAGLERLRQTPVFPWLAAAGLGTLVFGIKESGIPVTI